MKNPAIFFIMLMMACQPKSPVLQETGAEEQRRDKLTGAWKMTNHMMISHEGDTSTDQRQQYKMYVDGSVMWGFEAAPDSTEWFGYGTYFIEGDSLYETMTSGSWAFRQAIQGQHNFFRIGITVNENTYSQIIKDEDGISYESYERVMN